MIKKIYSFDFEHGPAVVEVVVEAIYLSSYYIL